VAGFEIIRKGWFKFDWMKVSESKINALFNRE